MSILGMNLGLQTKTFGGEVNFLDSQERRFIRGGATIDKTKVSSAYTFTENQITRTVVPAGMFAAKLANGKYCPVKSTILSQATVATDTVLHVQDARNFQVGDTIGAIAVDAVDFVAKTITLDAQIGSVKNIGDEIKAVDGGDAAFLMTENVEVSLGDSVTTGIDEGRVNTARLPMAPTDFIKVDLKEISFASY